MKNIKITITVSIILLFETVIIFLYFNPQYNPIEQIKENEKVIDAKILESKIRIFTIKYDIEINTNNKYKIILHNVGSSLKNRGIHLWTINNISYYGGCCYELEKKVTICDADDIEILGKILNIQLESVNDVIDNIEQLYNLYSIFEINRLEEHIYRGKYVIKADFRKN